MSEAAKGRKGDTAIRRYGEVVQTAFEDEDDDEYEDDGPRVVWRSLITFGYSGDVQMVHCKSLERRFFLTGSRLW